MANRLPRICTTCGHIFIGRCQLCAQQRKASSPPRLSAHRRGYDEVWQARSRAWRFDPAHRERLWCADPFKLHGLARLATVVDHIIPHKGDRALFWDETNWQSLCGSCNSIKAAKLEGAFGNRGALAVPWGGGKEGDHARTDHCVDRGTGLDRGNPGLTGGAPEPAQGEGVSQSRDEIAGDRAPRFARVGAKCRNFSEDRS